MRALPIPWPVVIVWAGFLARLAFYSTMLPLWEGYDEWAHFSVIRTMALHGDFLVARDQPIPRDVERSLQLAPVPWELRDLPPPSVTQDAYWKLPAEEREARETDFRNIPPGWSGERSTGPLTAYEALQPPLYYWMMAPVVRLASGLAGQVMLIRWFSILIASAAIPLVFLIARQVLGDARLALGCAAAAAVMPELAIDVARVGNECLGILVFTILTWVGLRFLLEGPTYSLAAALGLALGCGLLTKAYFLTAVPAVLLLSVYVCRRKVAIAFVPLTVAGVVSGWWYWRNLLVTGTLSGLSESVLLRGMSPLAILERGLHLNWKVAIDAILFSHIYFGDWSSLTVRSWMYHLFYVVIAVAAAGLVRGVRRPGVPWLLTVYALLWLGQLYNVLLLFVSKGLAGSMGWYLYAVVAAEIVLCVAGLARIHRWAPAVGVMLLALLDLYTVHAVAIPYYTGMIQHRANGAIAALHGDGMRAVGFRGAVERLTAFKGAVAPEPLLIVLWLAYLGGTAVILILALRSSAARKPDSAAWPPSPESR